MKRSFKKIAVVLVALIIAVGTISFPNIVEAKVRVGTPKMRNWYKSAEAPYGSNGVQYTIKWNKVKGASGYQVQKYERSLSAYGNPGKWYKFPTILQKGCSTSIQFSVSVEIKARVRAYKIVNGRRVYGKWSKVVSKKVIRW